MKGASIGARELWHFATETKAGRQTLNTYLVSMAKQKAAGPHRLFGDRMRRTAHTGANALALAYVSGQSLRTISKAKKSDRGKARELFPPMLRGEVAAMILRRFANRWKAGYFESVIPADAQKAATRKAARAARQHIGPDECPRGTVVQTLIFPRGGKVGWTRSEAKAWALAHGFTVDKIDASKASFRIRQHPPSVLKGKRRTISLGASGAKAVVACPKKGAI